MVNGVRKPLENVLPAEREFRNPVTEGKCNCVKC